MENLRIGERFPELQAQATDGRPLRIPDELRDLIAVLIFYRGHW